MLIVADHFRISLLADRFGSFLPFATVSRLPCFFAGTCSFVNIMSQRTTNNSLAAGLDATFQGSLDEHELPASSNAAIVPSSMASDATSSLHQASSSDVPSLAFLASVISAVKQALAAEQPTNSVQASSYSHTSVPGAIGGVPATFTSSQQSLQGQASAFAASGVGFPAVPASIAGSVASSQGRPNFIVPSFVSTFSAPLVSSVVPSPSSIAMGLSSSLPSSLPAPPLPALQQSFVLPPGYSPVPPKLVNQIVANKFVELSDLLSKNIEQSQSDNNDPQLYFDGRFYLTSTPKKPKRRIEDIGGWMEAFSIYCCVLTAHFPNRAKDLLLYQMIILRPYRQFTGRVWLAYNRAFREHAAATNLTNWSEINTQLFNFHSAGASVRGDAAPVPSEPRGAVSATIVCRSWNNGRCVAPSAACRFAHKCASCSGQHRATECPSKSSNQSGSESKRPPPSPPRSRSKSGRS